MKLARATHFIVCTNDQSQARRYYRQPSRPDAPRVSSIRRPRLIARSHVSPLTQQLECSWSLEATAADSQLCRYQMQRRRSIGKQHPIVADPRSHITTFGWCAVPTHESYLANLEREDAVP
jgi:hypothetical protein